MSSIEQVRSRIHRAAEKSGRSASDITLVAVSKRHPAEAVAALAEASVHHFGENQLPEGSDKKQLLEEQGQVNLNWHFIGPLQSNKSRTIAEEFDWLQSLDRLKIARRLQNQRPEHRSPVNVLIQINIDREPQKAGIAADDLMAFAGDIAGFDRLRLRGIMIIPKPLQNGDAPLHAFDRARALFDDLSQQYPGVDTLSMGMSADFERAIEAGSTMVRIGSALFGPRQD